MPCDHLVEGDADCPDVSGRPHLTGLGSLFRANVLRRTQTDVGGGESLRSLQVASDTEIKELYLQAFRRLMQKDILRLEIPMHDTRGVSGRERLEGGAQYEYAAAKLEGFVVHVMMEIPASKELHHHKDVAVTLLSSVLNSHDARVADARGYAHLAAEPLQEELRIGPPRLNELECERLSGQSMLSKVDRAHTPATNELSEDVPICNRSLNIVL